MGWQDGCEWEWVSVVGGKEVARPQAPVPLEVQPIQA